MSGPESCLACGSARLEHIVDLGEVPAFVGASWADPGEARDSPRGLLDLWLCADCGHVANGSFDPTLLDYDADYDNSLHFSPTFQAYAAGLADRLVTACGVRQQRIVEIGSGRGDFLEALCRLGGNTGVGYDPTYQPEGDIPAVTLVPDYFRPGQGLDDYDLLVSRHVLEHLADPAALITSIRESAPDDALFYFEVPSAEFNFGPDGLWDCIYPHVSYFSTTSLCALLRRCGFRIDRCARVFGGQFLSVEARPGQPCPPENRSVAAHRSLVHDFAGRWRSAVASWRREIEHGGPHEPSLVLWGAGSKGVTFLNAVDEDRRLRVVDANPRKWGRYLPGTGHEVLPPRTLGQGDVSAVLVTNPLYREEIGRELDDLGIPAAVVSV